MNIQVYNQLIIFLKNLYYREQNIKETIELIKIIARFSFIHYTNHLYSAECETILNDIASKYVKNKEKKRLKLNQSKKNILHIFSTVSYGGGHTRLASNWIENSFEDESHHLLLLSQSKEETPYFLEKAIKSSSGEIFSYENLEDDIKKAENLRSISCNFDYIVLHIIMDDPICNLSFNNKKSFNNIFFMNHADHLFWLGQSIATSYLQLSKSRQVLNYLKRDIVNSSILPIPLKPPNKIYSKDEARKILDLDLTKKIFLSIASPYKYISDDNVDFLKMANNLIDRSENTILIVIGPDKNTSIKWKELYKKTKGRIDAIGYIKEELSLYHFSCDIYLDSFPYGSFTSTLEPALLGKPCVTLSYGSMDVIDSFIEAGFVVDTQEEFILKAIALLHGRKKETKTIIESYHIKENWQQYLKKAYKDLEEDSQFKVNLEFFEKKNILDRFDNFSLKNSKNVKKYFFIKKIKRELSKMSFKNKLKVNIILTKNYNLKNKIKGYFYLFKSSI